MFLTILPQALESSPIIVALLAMLALPGVTSLVTSTIRRASDSLGIDPRVIVYTASLVVTGVLLVTGTVEFPAFDGDPAAFVGAWLVWGTTNAELARRVYELLLSRLTTTEA